MQSTLIGKAHLPRPLGTTVAPKEPGGPVYPVGGNVWPVAVYYMYINVGTPALPYCVAIDTGSTTAAVSDITCTSCSKNPANYNFYNHSSSSTSTLVQAGGYGGTYETCNFADPGASCSDSGDLYSDTVGIGSGTSLANYQIGSMTYVQSNFDQFQVCGGIMGLFGDTLFSELVTAGQYKENIFGMCLAATEGAQSNGTINFGVSHLATPHAQAETSNRVSSLSWLSVRSFFRASTTRSTRARSSGRPTPTARGITRSR